MEGGRLLFCMLWCGLLCFLMGKGQSFNSTPLRRLPEEKPSVTLPRSSRQAVIRAYAQAKENLSNTRRIVPIRRPMALEWRIPAARHRLFHYSWVRPQRQMDAQETFEEASRILRKEFNFSAEQITSALGEAHFLDMLGENRDEVEKCMALSNNIKCDRSSWYRTMDGTCNNLNHPSWGMAFHCFQRLLEPSYADGASELRTARSGRPLPSPRRISLEIHSQVNNPTDSVTHMLMQWGQFFDHDISRSPLNSGEGKKEHGSCCPVRNDNHRECLPVILEKNDPFFSSFNLECIENLRTLFCSTCTAGPRQQTNQLTAYIDASQVYGVHLNESRGLRTLDGTGRLLSQMNSVAGELLPESPIPEKDECSFQDSDFNCFHAGDDRVNQHPGLTSLHTVFLREHNRLARRLNNINPSWDDERLYQEARRIVGAEMQMITYKEFLPLIIGPQRMEWFDLSVRRSGYTQYNSSVEATILNEFSTAAFRFGHSLLNSFFAELDSDTDSRYQLKDIFFYPFGLYRGQMERVLRGLARSWSQKFDRYIVRDVTNHLFQVHGKSIGTDLVSLNVLRGRDHGIRGYTDYIKFCGGPRITRFRELDTLFQEGVIPIFQRIYESVEDIDLFSGGLAEKPVPGAVVGPTFRCIMEIQFHRLKYGDRFYFEHGEQAGSFTPEQLDELRKITLGKIICENTGITEIQPNVMLFPNERNPTKDCRQLPEMDVNYWRDSAKRRKKFH